MRFIDWVKLILLVFALLVALRFLGQIAGILLLFALVIIFAMMLNPPVSWLERHRVPRVAGAILVVLTVLGALAGLGVWLAPSLLEQLALLVTGIPTYWDRAEAWVAWLTANNPRVQAILAANEALINQATSRLGDLLIRAGEITLGLVTGLAGVILVGVMTVFTLIAPRPLLNGLFAMLPERAREPTASALLTTAQQMRVYAWSSLLVGAINGTVAWIGLSLLGVEPSLLLAALVFFGEFLPYVGPIGAAIPAIALAFLVSPLTALWTLLLYVAIQQLEAAVLSPLILSRQMKFHPLSVAFAILALGSIYGIVGAFLAVPLLAAVKAFYTEFILKPRQVHEEQLAPYTNRVVEAERIGKQDA